MKTELIVLLILSILLLAYMAISSTLTTNHMISLKKHGNEIKDQGYTIAPKTFELQDIKTIREVIHEYVGETPEAQHGNINTHTTDRFEILLPFRPIFREAILHVCDHLKDIFDVLGQNPWIVEHSVMLSFPGSKPQRFHADNPIIDEDPFEKAGGTVLSFFCALCEIEADMGPFQFVPGSHTKSAMAKVLSEMKQPDCSTEELNRVCGYLGNHDAAPFVDWTASSGDCMVYTSTLVHRGSGNNSRKLRDIWYFSLLFGTDEYPRHLASSMMKDYHTSSGKSFIKLSDLRDATSTPFLSSPFPGEARAIQM